MVIAWVWITLSLITAVGSWRRSMSVPRAFGRFTAFFVVGGAMVTPLMVASGPVAAVPNATISSDSTPAESGPVVIGGASELQLVSTAVMSGLIGAGVAVRLRARDHERRRTRGVDDEAITHDRIPDESHDEFCDQMLRAERKVNEVVDVVHRIHELAPDGEIRHVIDEHDGWYVIEFTHPVKAIPGAQMVNSRSVRLRPDSSTSHIRSDESTLPVLVHVGRAMSGEVWVSLDAYRDFAIDCGTDEGERVWAHVRESLVMAPTLESHGVVCDVDVASPGPRRVFRVAGGASVADETRRLGESIAIVHEGETPTIVPTLRRVTTGRVESGLARAGGEWRLLPVDIPIRPVGTDDDDIRRIRNLLGEPLPPIDIGPTSESTSPTESPDDSSTAPDQGWVFMACVLGPPQVVRHGYEPVQFERGKAEELVIWLAFHPAQRKRSLARSALWLSPVQDATFSNITAAARRSLNAVASPPDGQTWVGITMSDELPLADGFVTDVDVLREAVDWARRRPEDGGLERLRAALQLVRGVPFAGSTYTWSDGIGMSGDAATLVVRAASMMAEMCQEIGDMGGVYWATAKGLSALPGHEDLVAIRLRAHAEHGDRVAMKAEWESYRRAVASEWGDAEPSSKMMELWRRLDIR